MISRIFGLEIGGAIGVPLYISQAISVAFYIIGFTEALSSVYPGIDPAACSISIALLFGFLAYLGADFVLKIQFIVLAVLTMAMVSLFAGGWHNFTPPQFIFASESTVEFWNVFAVFFPAVTGIMVGVSMSGDLKDPARSIPTGTISSIIVTAVIYIAAAIWLSIQASQADLIADNMIMQKISRWPILILIGVWLSTLSSALGSILAAPRTLQALSFDRVVPKFAGFQMGSKTEPRLAVIITTVIAITIILMGDLNFVAPIITMFFLNTYGMINLTAGVEKVVGNPSFRPRIKVPWYISFIGGLGCYGAMFLINITATLFAILISYSIYFILKRRSFRQKWGDIRSGLWFSVTRLGLFKLNQLPQNIKNWRPNIAVFSGAFGTTTSRTYLKDIGGWLSKGQGIISLHHLLVGDVDEISSRGLRRISRNSLVNYINSKGVMAFAECNIVSDFDQGVINTMQAHGFRGFEPNTALFGWSPKPETQKKQFLLMLQLIKLKKSILFLYFNEDRGFGRKKKIDIWWRGLDRNAELMLLLAHIICRNPSWKDAEIRVLSLIDNKEGISGFEKHINALLNTVRVKAKAVILVKKYPEQTFEEIAADTWRESDLVFMGLSVPQKKDIDTRIIFLRKLLKTAPTTILVRSSEVEEMLAPELESKERG